MLKVLVSGDAHAPDAVGRAERKVSEAGFHLTESCHEADVGVVIGAMTVAVSWLQGRGRPVLHCNPFAAQSSGQILVIDDLPYALALLALSRPGAKQAVGRAYVPAKARAAIVATIEKLAREWEVPLKAPEPQATPGSNVSEQARAAEAMVARMQIKADGVEDGVEYVQHGSVRYHITRLQDSITFDPIKPKPSYRLDQGKGWPSPKLIDIGPVDFVPVEPTLVLGKQIDAKDAKAATGQESVSGTALPAEDEKQLVAGLSETAVLKAYELAIDGGNLRGGHFWTACGFSFRLALRKDCPVITLSYGEVKDLVFGNLATAAKHAREKFRERRLAEIEDEKKHPFRLERVKKSLEATDRYKAHGIRIDYCGMDQSFLVTPPETVGTPGDFSTLESACKWAASKYAQLERMATALPPPCDGSADLPYWQRVELNVWLPLEGVRNVLKDRSARWSAYGYDITMSHGVRNHEPYECVLVQNKSQGFKTWEHRTVEEAVAFVRKEVVAAMKAGKI